jgi:hypothetical protein
MVTAQLVGLVLIAVGISYLWSPWALVIAGALLVIVPELSNSVRRK